MFRKCQIFAETERMCRKNEMEGFHPKIIKEKENHGSMRQRSCTGGGWRCSVCSIQAAEQYFGERGNERSVSHSAHRRYFQHDCGNGQSQCAGVRDSNDSFGCHSY